MANQTEIKTEGKLCTAIRALTTFENNHPEIAQKYFDMRFPEIVDDDWAESTSKV